MIRRTFLGIVVAAFSLLGIAQQAHAQKSADTLRLVFRDAVTNIDPYYNQLRVGIVLQHMAWDGLVYRDPDTFAIKPLLATEWKLVDPLTIDFTLRQGVKFHDGSTFTADDAVYTINLVSNPASKVSTPSNYSWIDHAEKTGDYAIRVKLKKPTPAALESFALVLPMYPKAYREKVGEEGYAKAPVGAGPYKITKVEPGVSADFERFDGYWADSPKGRPAIKNISVRYVPDAATEMTELLAQRADWIWQFNPDQFASINRMPYLQAVQKESMRIGFVSIDAAGRSGADNPLTKLKVRQAIWYAIDRQTIADKLVTGGSRVPPAPCYPTQFGCDGDAAVKYNYDPAKAKALLAEAGYPNGFEIEFVSYMLPTWEAAVQNYLQAVGIRAKLTHMQVQAVIERVNKGETPLNFGSWGSYSINDVSAILPNYFTFGDADYARDPEVKRLIEEGGATNELEKRHAAYAAAIKRITEQAYWLPMFTYTTSYAYSKDLEFTPYPDELPRFYLCKWK
jgi:peptide/nickel transport system substrate-binding protein